MAPVAQAPSSTTASTSKSMERKDPPDVVVSSKRAAINKSSKHSDTTSNTSAATASAAAVSAQDDIVLETLDRLTQGIPKQELRLFVSEANECEEALKKDIELLEKALEEGNASGTNSVLDEIVESPFTPLDRFWTASSLLGRLRGAMAPPSLFHDINKANKANPKASIPTGAKSSPEAQKLLDMMSHPAYSRTESVANILACWKKIFSNRAAIVFKKPVRDEEAPGYSERIHFPMDLSLVRKMIVTRHITSFQQLHSYIGLIAHNCVKYNGRETDYGIVAREFEAMADETIRQAVLNVDTAVPQPTAPETAAATAKPAAAVAPASSGKVVAAASTTSNMPTAGAAAQEAPVKNKRQTSAAAAGHATQAAPAVDSQDSTMLPTSS